jgi:hypothetical protein
MWVGGWVASTTGSSRSCQERMHTCPCILRHALAYMLNGCCQHSAGLDDKAKAGFNQYRFIMLAQVP